MTNYYLFGVAMFGDNPSLHPTVKRLRILLSAELGRWAPLS